MKKKHVKKKHLTINEVSGTILDVLYVIIDLGS